MPLVSRKRPLEIEQANQQTNHSKRFKARNIVLYECDRIGYVQDHHHSIYRSIPSNLDTLQSLLAREIGSLLNGDGGILCFGCRPHNGTIYGDIVSRKEEDTLKLTIDTVFKRFRPMVEPQNYRVTFTKLVGQSWWDKKERAVLEIRVQPGEPFDMYEDIAHEVYLRKNNQPYGPLTPHEIKRHTVQQLRKNLKATAPLQVALQTPNKSIGGSLAHLLLNRKSSLCAVQSKLVESSGSDEDPIAVAVVKPIVCGSAQPPKQGIVVMGQNGKVAGDTANPATKPTTTATKPTTTATKPTATATKSTTVAIKPFSITTKPTTTATNPTTTVTKPTTLTTKPSTIPAKSTSTKPTTTATNPTTTAIATKPATTKQTINVTTTASKRIIPSAAAASTATKPSTAHTTAPTKLPSRVVVPYTHRRATSQPVSVSRAIPAAKNVYRVSHPLQVSRQQFISASQHFSHTLRASHPRPPPPPPFFPYYGFCIPPFIPHYRN